MMRQGVITMAQQKILVVDDDLLLHRLTKLSLERAGYQVTTATTGEKGVEKVRTEKPDLVLMDVMMPGIDGFEAAKRIRRLPEGRHLPIIFLSALDGVEAKVKALRGGGDDYITKPVKVGELLARIEVQLRTDVASPGQSIVVFGSKAGVGATTLAVNLALALHKVSQKDVLLVDWQRPLGDAALFLGMPEIRMMEFLLPYVSDLNKQSFTKVQQMFTDIVKEYSPGVRVVLGATTLQSAGQMTRKALDNMLEVALTEADYVLVDAGSFFSWENPPLINREGGINLCVLMPELVSIKRAVRAMDVVNVMDHSFWLILNRYGTLDISPKQIESHLKTVLKGCVPDEGNRADRALSEGIPLYTSDPGSGFSRAMDDIATRIHKDLETR
jgi:CheY-like chemotaxis protein/cellulose biosynthesis protein BcsQ